MSAISRIYFSADEDYLAAAADELRLWYPDAMMAPVGPDIAVFEDEGVAIAELAETIRRRLLAFPRHLMRGVGELPHAEATSLVSVGEAALDAWNRLPVPPRVSLHVWQSGRAGFGFRNDALWRFLADALESEGTMVVRGGASHILSAVETEAGIIFGSNGTASALVDWPGGRVRLARPKGQISRAEFKLEELFRTGAVRLPASGTALDLGAAPGGWTRILLDRGFVVWAVDTGALDARLIGRPGLHIAPMLAGPFLAQTQERFDLVVNDMRMEPLLSASIMNSAARFVAPHGIGIMSLKLYPARPRALIDDALAMLGKAWEPIFIRQLHHNRHEVTVVLQPRKDTATGAARGGPR